MRILQVFLIVFLTSCATGSNKDSTSKTPVDPELKKEFDAACTQGVKEACFVLAMNLDPKTEKEKIDHLIKTACDRGHAQACTQLGIQAVSEKNNRNDGIAYSIIGCREMDATGCYNAACFSCLNGDKANALKYLARSIELGLDQPSLLKEDPDLECLRKEVAFQAISENLLSRKSQMPTTPYHHAFHSLGLALSIPSGFNVVMNFPATLKDSSGSWIRITSAPVPFQFRIDELKRSLSFLGKNPKEELSEVNGIPQYSVKFDIPSSNAVGMLVVLGNAERTVRMEGFVPKLLEAQFGSLIFASLRTAVFDPRSDFSQPLIDFDLGQKFLDLKFVGPVEAAIEFTKTGKTLQGDQKSGWQESLPKLRIFPIRSYENGVSENFERMSPIEIVHETLPRLQEINTFGVKGNKQTDDAQYYVTEVDSVYKVTSASSEIPLYSVMLIYKAKPAIAFLASWSGALPAQGKAGIMKELKLKAKNIQRQLLRKRQ